MGIFTFLVSSYVGSHPGIHVSIEAEYSRLTSSIREQVDAYPQYAASALAANGFARSSFAGEADSQIQE